MTYISPALKRKLTLARRALKSGKRSVAERLYSELIVELPDNPEAWFGLAQTASSTDLAASAAARVELLGGYEEPKPPVTAPIPTQVLQPIPEVTESDSPSDTFADKSPEHQHDVSAVGDEQELLFCKNHDDRSTTLKCNRCGEPICSDCATQTSVGYRCPECIRELQEKFFEATPRDYILATIAVTLISILAGGLGSRLGFFIILAAPLMGTLLSRTVTFVTQKRRGRSLPRLITALSFLSLLALPILVPLVIYGTIDIRSLLYGLAFATLTASSLYYRLR